MRTPPGIAHSCWNEPSYEIKVRETMYLWGSAGITADLVFNTPLLLHFQNDLFGEVITFGTRKAAMRQYVAMVGSKGL